MMRNPRGFTLVEAAVSTVVVALMLSASLNAAGAARQRARKNEDRATALWLAQSLMSEIVERSYMEPSQPSVWGPEAGETQARRATLDDLDDFDNLKEGPILDADGVVLPGLVGWARSVSVNFVQAGNFTKDATSNEGFKRVIVKALRGGKSVAELSIIRSKAKDTW